MSAISELSGHLVTTGHGVLATTLFEGLLPKSPDVCRSVVATGGAPTVRHFGGVAYEVRRYQVFVRDTTYAAAESRAELMHTTFDAIANLSLPAVTPTARYLTVDALQPPYLLERDENDRVVMSFNIEAWRHPL